MYQSSVGTKYWPRQFGMHFMSLTLLLEGVLSVLTPGFFGGYVIVRERIHKRAVDIINLQQNNELNYAK